MITEITVVGSVAHIFPASAYLLTSPESKNDANAVDGEESDSESSDSDGFWEQMKTEASQRSPIDVYTEDFSHTVTSL